MDGHGEQSGILDAVAVGALIGAIISAPLWVLGALLTCVAWLLRGIGYVLRRGR